MVPVSMKDLNPVNFQLTRLPLRNPSNTVDFLLGNLRRILLHRAVGTSSRVEPTVVLQLEDTIYSGSRLELANYG